MKSTIEITILGDYGPFSEQGKSIGYHLEVNGDTFLVDLGAPLFQQIGGEQLKNLTGTFITHCHDDHKRWFTDLALYYMYTPHIRNKLPLITSDDVAREVRISAGPALNRSLDGDSKQVVNIAYENYVDHLPIGPRARYRLKSIKSEGHSTRWTVVDAQDRPVSPGTAKVVLSSKSTRPRMLFRDPETGAWVEPESYYPVSSPVFYEEDARPFIGNGYRIDIINAPVWHGLSNFGLVITAGNDKLILSSDTMHNLTLWRSLVEDHRTPRHDLNSREFLEATTLDGDINDYIQRTWSRERYEEAIRSFDSAAVIHDVTGRYGVVHTEYHELDDTVLDPSKTLLTHSPDVFTVVGWKLIQAGKRYRVQGTEFVEVGKNGRLWPVDADVYHKSHGHFFAGHKNPDGRFHIYEDNGYHSISDGPDPGKGELLFRVNLFEDVGGNYLPCHTSEDQFYHLRTDGSVELIRRSPEGSHGRVVEDLREVRDIMDPSDLQRLANRSVEVPDDDLLRNEHLELQKTLEIMREKLESQEEEYRKNLVQGLSTADAELTQLRQTVAALRDELSMERTRRESEIDDALQSANAEIGQLRETVTQLRETLERKNQPTGQEALATEKAT
jgi:hypothetical protein